MSSSPPSSVPKATDPSWLSTQRILLGKQQARGIQVQLRRNRHTENRSWRESQRSKRQHDWDRLPPLSSQKPGDQAIPARQEGFLYEHSDRFKRKDPETPTWGCRTLTVKLRPNRLHGWVLLNTARKMNTNFKNSYQNLVKGALSISFYTNTNTRQKRHKKRQLTWL